MAAPAETLQTTRQAVHPRSTAVELADTDTGIEACQRLRLDVFARELGAALSHGAIERDADEFDAGCETWRFVITPRVWLLARHAQRAVAAVLAERAAGSGEDAVQEPAPRRAQILEYPEARA